MADGSSATLITLVSILSETRFLLLTERCPTFLLPLLLPDPLIAARVLYIGELEYDVFMLLMLLNLQNCYNNLYYYFIYINSLVTYYDAVNTVIWCYKTTLGEIILETTYH